jgi:hypothetical protein
VAEFFQAEVWKGKSPPVEAFESIAHLITPNPPVWLIEHLRRWLPLFTCAEEKLRPSRAEMRARLAEIQEAASLLTKALGNMWVVGFLDHSADQPLPAPGNLRVLLMDLSNRAAKASRSAALINSEGRTKAGRGRAFPQPAISGQAYCALLIAETWSHFRDHYPPLRNKQAAEAADDYWGLAGGEKQSWGDDKLLSWRHHFREALNDQSPEMNTWRKEYKRHLCESARLEAALAERSSKGGM